MKVVTAEFVTSAAEPSQYPQDDLPEIAFAGKSNVGKSSLINTLVYRKNLARTSNTPGRTQRINFFRINDRFMLVDLPGYGYAKVPEAVKKTWGPMVETYIRKRSLLRLVILILDIRRDPSGDDLTLIDWLNHYHIPVLYVLTKADKFSRSAGISRQRQVRELLGLTEGGDLLMVSARTGDGFDTLRRAVEKHLPR